VKTVEASKEDLMVKCGYEEIVIEDFYDTFLDVVKKTKEI
jgi:hypothetical protein